MDILSLFSLKGKQLEDLSIADLTNIATMFGYDIQRLTPELRQAALLAPRGENIHSVADVIQSPESVKLALDILRGKADIKLNKGDEAPGFVHQCVHCGQMQAIYF